MKTLSEVPFLTLFQTSGGFQGRTHLFCSVSGSFLSPQGWLMSATKGTGYLALISMCKAFQVSLIICSLVCWLTRGLTAQPVAEAVGCAQLRSKRDAEVPRHRKVVELIVGLTLACNLLYFLSGSGNSPIQRGTWSPRQRQALVWWCRVTQKLAAGETCLGEAHGC